MLSFSWHCLVSNDHPCCCSHTAMGAHMWHGTGGFFLWPSLYACNSNAITLIIRIYELSYFHSDPTLPGLSHTSCCSSYAQSFSVYHSIIFEGVKPSSPHFLSHLMLGLTHLLPCPDHSRTLWAHLISSIFHNLTLYINTAFPILSSEVPQSHCFCLPCLLLTHLVNLISIKL